MGDIFSAAIRSVRAWLDLGLAQFQPVRAAPSSELGFGSPLFQWTSVTGPTVIVAINTQIAQQLLRTCHY